MKQSVRKSIYRDYIAVDFVNENGIIQSTPFYITPKVNIEVHFGRPQSERCENPFEYDEWFERYLFKMENGKLLVNWLNGPMFGRGDFTEVKPNELTDWRLQFASKIKTIIK